MEAREHILERAYQSAIKINQAAVRCAALTRIATVWLLQHEHVKSVLIMNEALKTAEMLKYPHEKARALAGVAAVAFNLGQSEEAHQYILRAIRLARASETPAQSMEALYRLAVTCQEAGLTSLSRQILEEMYKIALTPDNSLDSAAELVSIAELYDDLGDKTRAQSILTESLNLAEEIPDSWFRLERLIDIADTFSSTAEPEKALKLIQRAQKILEKIDEVSLPYFLLRLAEIFARLKMLDEAGNALQRVPPLILSRDTPYEIAGGLMEVAEKYLAINRPTDAGELLLKAAELAKNITALKEKVNLQIEIAGWLDAAGEKSSARTLALEAYSSAHKVVDKNAILFTLGNLALLYVYLQDTNQAAALVEDIIRRAQRTSVKTAGLGTIGIELVNEGHNELALQLSTVIREPEILVDLLIGIAGS